MAKIVVYALCIIDGALAVANMQCNAMPPGLADELMDGWARRWTD